MKKIALVFGFSFVCGSLGAQETSFENSEEPLNVDKKILSCPVPTIIMGKDVLVQPVRLTRIASEKGGEDRKIFKVEPYCNGENVADEDAEEPLEPENQEEPVKFNEAELTEKFVDFELGPALTISNLPGLGEGLKATVEPSAQSGEASVEEAQPTDWVVRPYIGIGLDHPLLVSVPMGVYIEDAETSNGFILQFAPGIDGYRIGAGFSTGFDRLNTYRTSLMLVVGKDGTTNQLNGATAWEDFEKASTFVGVQLMQHGIDSVYDRFPYFLLGIGYGVYIDGDQHEDGADFTESDLLLFQFGFIF